MGQPQVGAVREKMAVRTIFGLRSIREYPEQVHVSARYWVQSSWEWKDCGILLCTRRPVRADVVCPVVRIVSLWESEPSPNNIQDVMLQGQGPERLSIVDDTYGGFANGIPRKLVKFPSVTPTKSWWVVKHISGNGNEETDDGRLTA